MTNEQRKQLIKICQDELGKNNDPRALSVKLTLSGFTIEVDYCLKHDTGSGLIISVSVANPDQAKVGVPSPEGIDCLLTDWAKDYRSYLIGQHQALNDILVEIENGK